MKHLYLVILLFGYGISFAQSPEGLWKTINEKTGEVKSYIEIFASNGRYFGRIREVVEEDYIEVCHACSGDKHNHPIEDLVIIENLKPTRSGNKWRGGTVLDPKSGRTFSFSMWFESGETDKLKVRGKHWTGAYRTQEWVRAE